MTTANFDIYNYTHMIGAGWFLLAHSWGINLYRVTGHNGEMPTIENWQGEDITFDWFCSSTCLRTPERGFDWHVVLVPPTVADQGVIKQPRKLMQLIKPYRMHGVCYADLVHLYPKGTSLMFQEIA